MKRRTPPAARPAFTLVELLVAMALIIFIMYILAEAFAAGTTAFRNLKAIGDMNERLRSATTTLRRYLQADHFDGRRRLSDQNFWKNGTPREGFLRIVQSGLSFPEGGDLDGIPSVSSHTQALHLTVKLRGNNRGDYFRASVPNSPTNISPLLNLPFADSRYQDPTGNGVVCSPAAEVAIFLRNTGLVTDDPDSTTGNVQQPRYTMYFRQRLLVPDNSLLAATPYNTAPNFQNNWLNYLEVSAIQDPANAGNPRTLYFNNLQDVTMPGRRMGNFTINPATGLINAGNLPDITGPDAQGRFNPMNFISGDGDLSVSNGATPNAIRNPVYPRLADDDPSNLNLAGINPAGNDVLLTDVLSWVTEVLVDPSAYQQYQTSFAGPQPIGVLPPTGPVTANPAPPGSILPPTGFIELSSDILTPYMASPATMPRLFDTWSSRKDDFYDYSTSTAPMLTYNHPNNASHPLNGTKIRILAIKITLRIWDARTKQTRMTSVVVDL